MEKIISLQDVSIAFHDGPPVLQNLNLSLNAGESVSILGLGGCGKSTLLKLIVGIIKNTTGKIEICGQDVSKLNENEQDTLRKKIGIAFQQGALFDFMTVRENILFAMENMTNFSVEEQEKRVKSFLAQVNLSDVEDKIPSELSGGMRRRVGIVRAMVTNPELALLDEPTAGLDPVTTSIVIDMIHNIGKKINATMVCVTSSVEVAFRFAQKVAILKDGKIIGLGTRDELLNLGDAWITHFLTLRALP
ncbi:MAG: ATP-binding cassette domain-containing protein [Bdellovibrionota bacterium]